MLRYTIIWIATIGLLTSFNIVEDKEVRLQKQFDAIFSDVQHKPSFHVFALAANGAYELQRRSVVKSSILAVIDYSKPSTSKRLWIVDLADNTLLYHTLVAHGKKSGENYAKSFSNVPQSHKSSVGFFTTGETYQGKHGLSLRLDGVEKQINDNARSRAIVMHGADYVSESFIKKVGRLGRSHGCPAIPVDHHEAIINLLAGKACIFIWYPEQTYLQKSKLIDRSLI